MHVGTGSLIGPGHLLKEIKKQKQQKVSDKHIFPKNHKITSKIDYRNSSIPFVQISLNGPGHKFRTQQLKEIFQPTLTTYS